MKYDSILRESERNRIRKRRKKYTNTRDFEMAAED